MDLLEGAKNLINQSQTILVLPAKDPQGDILGSCLALFYTLKKLEKKVNLFCPDIPSKFQFLTFGKNFVISINTQEREIEEMHYEKEHNVLKIYFTLKNGQIQEKDISFNSQTNSFSTEAVFNSRPDLLITVGAKNFEDLGNYFERNPKFFYGSPILNIDNQPLNENFGQINLKTLTCCSISEIITELIKSMDEELWDENIATFLLTGIIFASQNFQNSRTRPKTFQTASYLIEKGADHQTIIQHLYKTKSISQVRLLGRILEKLNFDENKGLFNCLLTNKDFSDSQANSQDLGPVIEDLKFNFWTPRALSASSSLLILWEGHASKPVCKGILYSPNLDLIKKILENFEGVSKKEGVLFLVRDDPKKAQEKVLEILKSSS